MRGYEAFCADRIVAEVNNGSEMVEVHERIYGKPRVDSYTPWIYITFMTKAFPEPFQHCTGFDWDAGNAEKNRKHGVTREEAEEVFFNGPTVLPDARHSQTEVRWAAFGTTDRGRKLAIALTIRGDKIRVIMARDMSRKERRALYGEGTEEN